MPLPNAINPSLELSTLKGTGKNITETLDCPGNEQTLDINIKGSRQYIKYT